MQPFAQLLPFIIVCATGQDITFPSILPIVFSFVRFRLKMEDDLCIRSSSSPSAR